MAEEKFNVGGVILDRRFRIRRLGHFGFNVTHMEEGWRFYVDLLGFKVSDVMDYSRRAKSPEQVAGLGDPHGYFTRYGTDHHSMVLFPKRVRDALGRGVPLSELSAGDLAKHSELLDDEYYEVLDSARLLESKRAEGGTSPERLAEQLEAARSALAVVEEGG